MGQPTRIEAIHVQPGTPAFAEAGKQIVGVVSVEGKIFAVTAQYDLPVIPPPASEAPALAPPSPRGPTRGHRGGPA